MLQACGTLSALILTKQGNSVQVDKSYRNVTLDQLCVQAEFKTPALIKSVTFFGHIIINFLIFSFFFFD